MQVESLDSISEVDMVCSALGGAAQSVGVLRLSFCERQWLVGLPWCRLCWVGQAGTKAGILKLHG